MIPAPGVTILLSELNQVIAEQRGVAIDDLCIAPASKTTEVKEVATAREIPSTTETQTAIPETVAPKFDDAESEAKYYRSQADKLAKQAAEFRRKAEELAPTKKKVKEVA